MKKFFKYFLLLIIGLLLGFVIHGLIEIPALWLLRTRFISLFMEIPWLAWLRIHSVFTITTEILGIAITSVFYKKLIAKKSFLPETVIIASYILISFIIVISLFSCPVLNK